MLDTVTDFADGQDLIALDYIPGQVYHGAVQGTLLGAVALAQQLLVGHDGDAAAIQVGADTVLFYNSTGGLLSLNAVDFQNTNAESITTQDFTI